MSKPVSKSIFRVYKLKDGRVLAENPYRIDENKAAPSNMLVITAERGAPVQISVEQESSILPTEKSAIVSSTDVHGIVGVIELINGRYLLVITGRKLAATLQSHKIWKITEGICIPIGKDSFDVKMKLDDEELERFAVDQDLLQSIREIYFSGKTFYSTSYDITHSLQHNYLSRSEKPQATIVDDRYFFNEFLQKSIIEANEVSKCTTPWITKIIAGFAGMGEIDYKGENISNRTYHTVLISRLNHRRLGCRYIRRGLDLEGNAANNVEMEQIVFNNDFLKETQISSFVQIRGSVPSIWGQNLDLSYRPNLILADVNKDVVWKSTKTHLLDLKHQYIGEKAFASGMDHGQVVCVNLLDDTGFERPLTEIYESSISRIADPKFKYESFPVTKWCKKMNYSNMEILVDRVRLPLINSGWFVADGDVPNLFDAGSLKCSRIQTGVARTSCLDSLDRTNLTCSIFAYYILPYQVQSVSPGLPAPIQSVTGVAANEVNDPVLATRNALESSHREFTCLWADSGDNISLLYAGTGALKADVTRTGKRQVLSGSYADGTNSLTRYYLNNFQHGKLQDVYDIISGKADVAKIKSIFSKEGKNKAERLKNPLISRDSFASHLIPTTIVDVLEPLYFNLREFHKSDANKETVKDTMLKSLKEMAPKNVTNIIELILVMTISFWIIILSKIFKINGHQVVNVARINSEDGELKQLAK